MYIRQTKVYKRNNRLKRKSCIKQVYLRHTIKTYLTVMAKMPTNFTHADLVFANMLHYFDINKML